ncbi:FecR family protein [Marinobacteraceae bacterium S3BR75-40.1]
MSTRRRLPLAVLLLALSMLGLAGPAAAAANEAAKVIMANGDTTAVDANGDSRPLRRRSVVHVGDTVKTGEGALVQLRFSDKALMTLRPNSALLIEEYRHPHGDQGGSALMRLVTGGFRTITGSIGHGTGDAYQVRTASASIGIRGTHYDVLQTADQRLLAGVLKGGIRIANDKGALEIGGDRAYSYSVVPANAPPKGLSEPPKELEESMPVIEVEKSQEKADNQKAKDEGKDDGGEQQTASTGDESQGTQETQDSQTTQDSGETADTDLALADDAEAPVAPETDTTLESSSTTTTETTTDTTLSDSDQLDLTDTNTELQNQLDQPVDTSNDPSAADPRLTNAEYDQFLAAKNLAVVIPANTADAILATLFAADPIVPFDYSSAGAATFTVQYSIDDFVTVGNASVTLSSNITDLNTLMADINDDLIAAGAPVRVRESTLDPGFLEFYTNNSDYRLAFKLVNFQPVAGSSATVTDISATLGGLPEGAFTTGELHDDGPMTGIAILDDTGKPTAVAVPNRDPDVIDTTTTTTPPPPPFVSTTDPASIAPYDVGRQGDAPAGVTVDAVGGRSNISWGVWEASPSNPLYVYEDITDPTLIDMETDPVFWLTAEAANVADLTGTAVFQTAGDFLGRANDGTVSNVAGGFTVNFDTGEVTQGSLSVATPGNSWSANFNGVYQDAQAFMKVDSGDIVGTDACTACVQGGVGGVFVAPGDAFAGGFKLQKVGDINVHAEGLMLMEKQP